ncbi:MAG: histidine phosphatase family protein [Ferrimicrobium sp.]
MNVVFIRHGAGLAAERRVVGGHRGCGGLSAAGVREVLGLASVLRAKRISIDLLAPSTLRRSRQSATIIGSILEVPVLAPSCLLCEMHAGASDGLAFDDLVPYSGTLSPKAPIASGGESLSQLALRAQALVTGLLRGAYGEHPALVTHSGLIRCLIPSLDLPTAGIAVVSVSAKGLRVRSALR